MTEELKRSDAFSPTTFTNNMSARSGPVFDDHFHQEVPHRTYSLGRFRGLLESRSLD